MGYCFLHLLICLFVCMHVYICIYIYMYVNVVIIINCSIKTIAVNHNGRWTQFSSKVLNHYVF
jgi:hypothetical protein